MNLHEQELVIRHALGLEGFEDWKDAHENALFCKDRSVARRHLKRANEIYENACAVLKNK
jgi:hypothetical protein